MSISSLDLKKTSHLVKKTPTSSSTKNDCARGSYHPIIPCLCVCAITLLLTTWDPVVLAIALSSNVCLFSILAFLTDIIFSWTVSKVPLEENPSSAIVDARFWSFKLLFTNVKVLLPVSNLGWIFVFGFGIKKLPINVADKSERSLTLVIVAWAPLVWPISLIPDSTYPLKDPWGSFDSEKVSTFKIFDVEE